MGLVVGFDRGEPAFELLVAGAVGHHLGEAGDVGGQGVDVRAAGADARQLGLLATGSRLAGRDSSQRVIWRVPWDHGRSGGRRGGQLAERADVAAHGLRAACPAPGLQLGVQRGGVGDALRSTAG